MEFFTSSNEKRPIRLSEKTRAWAWEVMHGKYGDEARKQYALELDGIEGFEQLPEIDRYDIAVRKIAEEAPLRFCECERICGSATLGLAIDSCVPVTYKGESVLPNVSHLTICYERVLKEGLLSYRKRIAERLTDKGLSEKQIRFLKSLENVVDSFEIWHSRYLLALKEQGSPIYDILSRVPMYPARNFHEAVQSLWFVFAFVRLTGNWPGIGRIDELLGDYLEKDLANGDITVDEAREILASFFIKGCEWIESEKIPGSGDAQHYQNIVLSGIDAKGNLIDNTVTYLVLDIVEETGISDFPISVRLNKNTPEKLYSKITKTIRHGGGVVAVYNEDLVIRAFENEGYPTEEARRFANDGCWEVQVPGATDFAYHPFDSLDLFNKAMGINGEEIPSFDSVEEAYSAFYEELKKYVEFAYDWDVGRYYKEVMGKLERVPWQPPTSVVSLFEEDCIEKAASYFDSGVRYTVRSPHIGGAPDVANSFYAIEKAVFEEKKCTFSELISHVKNNWENAEALRLYIKNKYTYYGNDNDGADKWMVRILDDFGSLVKKCKEHEKDVRYIAGVSTFGRQIQWLEKRCATVFGYKKGEILSGNTSPTPGTDCQGATAIIRSYCKADLEKLSCGAALDVKILPATLKGENGLLALESLLKGFLSLGGFFMQLDTMETETLRAAQADPLAYKTLSVRVSGWNARFVTLNEDWQNMIIERNSAGI